MFTMVLLLLPCRRRRQQFVFVGVLGVERLVHLQAEALVVRVELKSNFGLGSARLP